MTSTSTQPIFVAHSAPTPAPAWPKWLPPKWLYDEYGSDLFERFTELDLAIVFRAGEHLHTEISAKFRHKRVNAELAAAGFTPHHRWTDQAGQFAVTLAQADR